MLRYTGFQRFVPIVFPYEVTTYFRTRPLRSIFYTHLFTETGPELR
jgi:hypothetical protein